MSFQALATAAGLQTANAAVTATVDDIRNENSYRFRRTSAVDYTSGSAYSELEGPDRESLATTTLGSLLGNSTMLQDLGSAALRSAANDPNLSKFTPVVNAAMAAGSIIASLMNKLPPGHAVDPTTGEVVPINNVIGQTPRRVVSAAPAGALYPVGRDARKNGVTTASVVPGTDGQKNGGFDSEQEILGDVRVRLGQNIFEIPPAVMPSLRPPDAANGVPGTQMGIMFRHRQNWAIRPVLGSYPVHQSLGISQHLIEFTGLFLGYDAGQFMNASLTNVAPHSKDNPDPLAIHSSNPNISDDVSWAIARRHMNHAVLPGKEMNFQIQTDQTTITYNVVVLSIDLAWRRDARTYYRIVLSAIDGHENHKDALKLRDARPLGTHPGPTPVKPAKNGTVKKTLPVQGPSREANKPVDKSSNLQKLDEAVAKANLAVDAARTAVDAFVGIATSSSVNVDPTVRKSALDASQNARSLIAKMDGAVNVIGQLEAKLSGGEKRSTPAATRNNAKKVHTDYDNATKYVPGTDITPTNAPTTAPNATTKTNVPTPPTAGPAPKPNVDTQVAATTNKQTIERTSQLSSELGIQRTAISRIRAATNSTKELMQLSPTQIEQYDRELGVIKTRLTSLGIDIANIAVGNGSTASTASTLLQEKSGLEGEINTIQDTLRAALRDKVITQ